MSRILFAAARGARIQVMYQRVWIPLTHISLTLNPYTYRIHPEDAHLEYGPISTALLKLAEDDSWNPSEERALALAVARQFQVYFVDEPDFELFYLILAEFLADEGM